MSEHLPDPELIAAIAKKFGWKSRWDGISQKWFAKWGTFYEMEKLPSTDACLALLDLNYDISKRGVGITVQLRLADGMLEATGFDSKSLPRAILFAILEMPDKEGGE